MNEVIWSAVIGIGSVIIGIMLHLITNDITKKKTGSLE